MIPTALARHMPTFSATGLILGTLFFAAALTPSLVPRAGTLQGLLGGLSLAAGYGLGVLLRSGWQALQLPEPRGRLRWRLRTGLAALCAVIAALALWRAAHWQDGLRALMGLPPVETVHPFTIAGVAIAVFLLLYLLALLIRATGRVLARRLARHLPTPQAVLLAVVLTALIFWSIGNGLVVRSALATFDASYARLDALMDPESPRPEDPLKTGSPDSLIDWAGLGRQGRAFIADPPDAARIAELTGGDALEPLRVYVGLNSAADEEARAALALAELIRIGAFERSHLVIATPTGTGWVDPEGQQALELLMRGDVATVAVQYSYVASWIALLTEPRMGIETARAVFAAVYDYWRELDPETRPRLWLNGLSLGAFNSDLSHDQFQVIADPYDGALWAGPPFPSRTWSAVTRQRNPDTPAWLPRWRDGSVIRFTSQEDHLDAAEAPWGPFRIAYLQYASDAIVFFEPEALWRRPEWLVGPRGPDVSPDLRWIPVVTFLQLGIDVMTAVAPPLGHGHTYAFPHYLDAWAALTEEPGWSAEDLEALKARMAAEAGAGD